MKKFESIKLTHDEWYSNFNGNGYKNQVKLTHHIIPKWREIPEIFRIMISGNDDFKMNFDIENKEISIKMFNKIRSMGYLDIEELEKSGFKIY